MKLKRHELDSPSAAVQQLLFLGFAASGFARDEQRELPLLRGPYLGQEPPGLEPVLFAPGVVSTDTAEWSMAFTPDGLEVFFGLFAEGSTYILHMRSVHGRWTEPAVASFSGKYPDYDLTMSPNGNRVYFTSLRPASGAGPQGENPDIWYVDRTEKGWGDPVRLPEPINTDGWDLYPSESKDGFLYFFSSRFCLSVSPDGKYLFFTSRRPKNMKIPRYRNTVREALGLAPDPERADIDIYWLDARYLDKLRPPANSPRN